MRLDEIFTEEELASYREALVPYRPPGSYEPGKWMVSPLNRKYGTAEGKFPHKAKIRDIALRTSEQISGVALSVEERTKLLVAIVGAGVPEVVLSAFRRGRTLEELRGYVEAAKAVAPNCVLHFGNAVKAEEIELAKAAGIDAVQVWSTVFVGGAMPVSAGAVYHRAWQGREWRDLNFPSSEEEHINRSRRLIQAALKTGVKVSGSVNLIHLATEEYVAKYVAAASEEGAYEVMLLDSSGGCTPEAIAQFVKVAKEVAPACEIAVHCHNIFGLGISNSLAGLRAGADTAETAVNGYEVGSAGSQASTSGLAAALEALYGVGTGIDLSKMVELSKLAEQLVGIAVPGSEPVVGSQIFESASEDEYEMEANFDRLIHGSIEPSLVGGTRDVRVGVSSGPLGMSNKLDLLNIKAKKEDIELILEACKVAMYDRKHSLSDEEIREIAELQLKISK